MTSPYWTFELGSKPEPATQFASAATDALTGAVVKVLEMDLALADVYCGDCIFGPRDTGSGDRCTTGALGNLAGSWKMQGIQAIQKGKKNI